MQPQNHRTFVQIYEIGCVVGFKQLSNKYIKKLIYYMNNYVSFTKVLNMKKMLGV